FISNWYTYVVSSIREAMHQPRLIKNNIDKNVVDAYRDYLKTWLKVLERYRDEIEKNKVSNGIKRIIKTSIYYNTISIF
ncbi:MAG: hypothetical protein QW215_08320, partial [Ignisphaera sp.]